MIVLRKINIICLLLVIAASSSYGQDTQYWAKQYGTYGSLLGGTVIGAVSDLSSTYYNPGAVAFQQDSSLILTTNSMQFIYLNFDKLFDTQISLDSWYTNASQGIFALRLPFSLSSDDQIVLSYISRQDFKFRSAGATIDPYPNEIYRSNQVLIDQSLAENWFGATWSKPISENIGLGVTMYVPYRSQRVYKQSILQFYDDIDRTQNIVTVFDYDYYNLRLLWKAGISAQLGNVMLGLSITTPSISLFGSGIAGTILSRAGVDSLNFKYPHLASNYQEDLSATYKSPLSIGLGGAYYWKNTVLYFSAEWYNSVNNFLVMEPESFIAQSAGEVYNYNVNYSLVSVFNFGFGVKYTFNKNFIYYGSISNDQTAFDPDITNPFVLSSWDIIHIKSGGEFKFYNLSITLGLGYGYSGQLFKNFNFFGVFENNETDVIYHQIEVIFGLTYSL